MLMMASSVVCIRWGCVCRHARPCDAQQCLAVGRDAHLRWYVVVVVVVVVVSSSSRRSKRESPEINFD